MNAEQLNQTPAAQACLEALRTTTGERHGPMERHGLRCWLIAERLAVPRPVDSEVLLCAAWLHDAGLWRKSGDPYVTEAARMVEETLAPFDWPVERVQRCMDACEQHHAPTSREHMGIEVELMRKADLVEVSCGAIAFGVPRSWLRGLFRAVPRSGFYPMITAAVADEIRRRPGSLLQVFSGPTPTRARAGG